MGPILSRRDVLRAGALGTIAGVTSVLAEPGATPNIIWLVSEDTSPDLGCYGESQARTPHLDRLAAEGVRFTRAFTSAPVCSASRSAFMTGMYQTSTGTHNHRSHRSDGYQLPDGVHVFTKYLRDAGYRIVCPKVRKTDFNFKPRVDPYDSFAWDDMKKPGPFFAQIQFSLTHRGGEWRKAAKDPRYQVDPTKVSLPPYYPDHPVARQDWADYIASINALDAEIGETLRKLEADGLLENTIVVYFGDHGRPMVRGKQWLYEGGIRIPLIVRWPDGRHAGTTREDLVNAIDFAPTTLRLAGVEPPKHMQGRIMLGPDRGPDPEAVFAARDRCDETVDRIRCAREVRYKYIRNFMPERPYTQPNRYKEKMYPVLGLMKTLHAEGKLTPVQARFMAPERPAEELYDLQEDPFETRNLASSPKHQGDLLRLVETDDQGRFPESAEEIEFWRKKSAGAPAPTPAKMGKRLAATGLLPREGWRIVATDSQETTAQKQGVENILDGDPLTCWHTEWGAKSPTFPHELTIDLGRSLSATSLRILPRQDRAQNGRIREVEVYLSDSRSSWGQPVGRGTLANALDEQDLTLTAAKGRFLRVVARSGYSKNYAAIAELNLVGE
jgi:arylsulfatase A-like enzyme